MYTENLDSYDIKATGFTSLDLPTFFAFLLKEMQNIGIKLCQRKTLNQAGSSKKCKTKQLLKINHVMLALGLK